MSARQQFQFPQAAGTPASGATFTPDPGNPLHAGSQGVATSMKEETFLGLGTSSSVNGNDDKSIQRPGTAGLSGLMKKKFQPVVGSAPANMIARPGTADPYAKVHQPFQKSRVPVVAPTPQVTRHSALLSRSSSSPHGFKVPSFIDHTNKNTKSVDNDAHILTSNGAFSVQNASAKPDHSSDLNSEQTSDEFKSLSNLKFNHNLSQLGPRRVTIEDHSVQLFGTTADHSASFSLAGHEVNEDGRVKAVNGRKRMRNEVDEDEEREYTYENPLKRFKPNQEERSATNFSPRTERPSSGLSHSGDHRGIGLETRESTLSQHYAYCDSQSQHFSVSPTKTKPYTPRQSHRVPEEPRPLAKLLGQDPDIYVQQHMQTYDQLVSKWTNCTMEEWMAGANEVASKYCKVLDYVKEHISMKIKVYGGLHNAVDEHNLVLKERSQVLTAARKKLVEESGSVLGK